MACRCHEPHLSELIALSSEVLGLGVGAHGWVVRICQPWEKSSSRSLLPIVESSWMFQAPNLQLAMQLLKEVKCNLTELTLKESQHSLLVGGFLHMHMR